MPIRIHYPLDVLELDNDNLYLPTIPGSIHTSYFQHLW